MIIIPFKENSFDVHVDGNWLLTRKITSSTSILKFRPNEVKIYRTRKYKLHNSFNELLHSSYSVHELLFFSVLTTALFPQQQNGVLFLNFTEVKTKPPGKRYHFLFKHNIIMQCICPCMNPTLTNVTI